MFGLISARCWICLGELYTVTALHLKTLSFADVTMTFSCLEFDHFVRLFDIDGLQKNVLPYVVFVV